jgi:hypothetical protein
VADATVGGGEKVEEGDAGEDDLFKYVVVDVSYLKSRSKRDALEKLTE